MFDGRPRLVGDLVELRPLRETDFSALYAVAGDRLIWEQHPSPDRYEAEVFRSFFFDQLQSGGALVVVDRSTNTVIGMSRFHGFDHVRREVEIGWTFLARSHWGGEYNREIKSLMLGYAFRFVDSVVFLVHPGNVRSQRAVEKLGALRAEELPDVSGSLSFAYVLSREQWETQNSV
jgi:N-acetyltransferase